MADTSMTTYLFQDERTRLGIAICQPKFASKVDGLHIEIWWLNNADQWELDISHPLSRIKKIEYRPQDSYGRPCKVFRLRLRFGKDGWASVPVLADYLRPFIEDAAKCNCKIDLKD